MQINSRNREIYRRICGMLGATDGQISAKRIAMQLEVTEQATSYHLRNMNKLGLVTRHGHKLGYRVVHGWREMLNG